MNARALNAGKGVSLFTAVPEAFNPWYKAEQQRGKMEYCGETSILFKCSKCGKRHALPSSCDIRICHNCTGRRFKKVAQKYHTNFIKKGLDLELLTFSYGRITPQDKHKVRMVKAATREICKKFYGGGLIVAEVTEKQADGEFHLHTHAVVRKVFINHSELKNEFQKRTGRRIVWIGGRKEVQRSARSSAAKLGYVTKYMYKVPKLSRWGKKAWLNLYNGVRVSGTCGEFYNHKGLEAPPHLVKCADPKCEGHSKHFGFSIYNQEDWDNDEALGLNYAY